ncbi:MAG: TIGR03013 family PEP-CTERM/XrtA system glycosyltransferase [Acidobacteria bacterium]|nr:TIGR03013 family PEP-CTERM/XrtA system glycosyltransferase [Acidobacteriota bacterium]
MLLPALDGITLTLAFLAATYLRFGQSVDNLLAYENLVAKAIVNTLVMQLCLYYTDLYEDWPLQRPLETALRFGQAFLAGLVALLIVYYIFPPLTVGRGILAFYLALGFFAVVSLRALYRWFGEEETLAENVIILGTGSTAQKVAREILKRRPWSVRVLGFLAEDPTEVGRRIVNPTVIGTVDELLLLASRLRAGLIVVALDDRRGKLPVNDLLRCRIEGVRVEEGAAVLERLTGQIPIKNLRPSWLVFSQGFDESRLLRRLKFAGEFAVAAVMLTLASPVILLVAIAIRLSSPGPVIYRQERVGERGRPFQVLKFRTMRADAEATTGPVWASAEDDPRITRLGRLLRKTRLDELPQLVNVVRGEMSFVGPRPERPHFVSALRQVIPFYDERHSVRPGISGWAQIRCGYGSSIEDAEVKLQFDLYYIKHMSFIFDISIIFDTMKVMVVGRGAR